MCRAILEAGKTGGGALCPPPPPLRISAIDRATGAKIGTRIDLDVNYTKMHRKIYVNHDDFLIIAN